MPHLFQNVNSIKVSNSAQSLPPAIKTRPLPNLLAMRVLGLKSVTQAGSSSIKSVRPVTVRITFLSSSVSDASFAWSTSRPNTLKENNVSLFRAARRVIKIESADPQKCKCYMRYSEFLGQYVKLSEVERQTSVARSPLIRMSPMTNRSTSLVSPAKVSPSFLRTMPNILEFSSFNAIE